MPLTAARTENVLSATFCNDMVAVNVLSDWAAPLSAGAAERIPRNGGGGTRNIGTANS